MVGLAIVGLGHDPGDVSEQESEPLRHECLDAWACREVFRLDGRR
jgi:hypothetical protein